MARETIDDIHIITKEILNYIKNSCLLTTNDLSCQMLIKFSKTHKMLEELKALFKEKLKPCFSKG